ncbi:MAG: AraC family transcriptional regulator, partial [Balneolaceae bacterium]|nr:AraC family transcriptional regulator [Balneolaceae bacterium]
FDNRNRVSNHLLALLLFALALRISKSVILILFPGSPDVLPAIGLIGMAAIGPFLYLYLQSIHEESFVFGRGAWMHLLPSLSIAAMLPLPFVDEPVIYRFYQFVVAQIFVYLILGYNLHRSYSRSGPADRIKSRWGYILLGATALIWLAFFAQLLADTFLLYLIATTVAAFALYGVSFWAMKNRLVFKENGRLNRINGDAEALSRKIEEAFETEKLHLDPDLTLDKLAESIKSQSYLVSMVVNDLFNMSFPELVNSYRVEEAKQRLISEKHRHLSIESIAYDCGFNSISSFYSSFKKICGTTPAEYRKQFT